MKKIVSSLLVFTLLVGAAQAQSGPTRPSREQRKEVKEEMEKTLGLTPEQSKEMTAINKSYGDQIKDVREDQTMSKDQKKEKLKQLNQERENKINEKLSPDQQAKWKQWKADKMKERKEKGTK